MNILCYRSTVPSITINLAPAEYLNEISMLVDVAYDKWNKLPLQMYAITNQRFRNKNPINFFYFPA